MNGTRGEGRHEMDLRDWTGWRAVIHPVGGGRYGVSWEDAPAMARRGGYSGPFASIEKAEEDVERWREDWEIGVEDITIEYRP
jgi:hypothetical protein